jgi:hypothetical protein
MCGGITIMIDVSKLTQAQIRQLGIEALTKALGPAGMARFMQQFEMGSGDYRRDREIPPLRKSLPKSKKCGEKIRRRAKSRKAVCGSDRLDFQVEAIGFTHPSAKRQKEPKRRKVTKQGF